MKYPTNRPIIEGEVGTFWQNTLAAPVVIYDNNIFKMSILTLELLFIKKITMVYNKYSRIPCKRNNYERISLLTWIFKS